MSEKVENEILEQYYTYISQEFKKAKDKEASKKLSRLIKRVLMQEESFLGNFPALANDIHKLQNSLERDIVDINLNLAFKTVLSVEKLSNNFNKLQRLKFPLEEVVFMCQINDLALLPEKVATLDVFIKSVPKTHNGVWCKIDENGNNVPPWTKKPDWASTKCRKTKKLWCAHKNAICLGSEDDKNSLSVIIKKLNQAGFCKRNNWRLPTKAELVSLKGKGGLTAFDLAMDCYVWVGGADKFDRAEVYNMSDRTKKITSVEMKYPALIVSG